MMTTLPIIQTEAHDVEKERGNQTSQERLFWWDRDVIYFGNVLSLFFGNEEQTKVFRREIGGTDSHGGRLVPLLNLLFRGEGKNRLYLEHEPDGDLLRYFERLGLSLPELKVLPRGDYEKATSEVEFLKELADCSAKWVDGYVVDSLMQEIEELTDKVLMTSHEVSRLGNDKVALHRFLCESGLPTMETVIAGSREEVREALQKLRRKGFQRAGVRTAIGASGIGLQKMETDGSGVEELPEYFFREGEVLVQGWLEKGEWERVTSPSVQIFANEKGAFCYDVTRQVLSQENHYKGNASEGWAKQGGQTLSSWAREEMLRQAEVVGEWLWELGFRGPAGVDFLHLHGRNGKEKILVCEANARVTGATYPSYLSKHFNPGGAWLMRNLKFTQRVPARRLLRVLERTGYLYEAGQQSGVLPYNLYLCDGGRVEMGQMLCLGPNLAACEELLEKAEAELPIDWSYERE